MTQAKQFDLLAARLDKLKANDEAALADIRIVRDVTHAVHAEIGKVVKGYSDPKWKLLQAMLADGHVLMESVPGLAKSLLVSCIQRAFHGANRFRIQFTPDLTTSEIAGVPIFNPGSMKFDDRPGPVVGCHILLGDEINRSPGKVQSALLAAMQERRIVVGSTMYKMEDPFFVLATQNPIENEGTYPLPEAQLDRFMLKIVLPYMSRIEELQFAAEDALLERDAEESIQPVVRIEDLVTLRKYIRRAVYRSEALCEYVVDLVRFTRPNVPEFAYFREKVAAKNKEHAKVLDMIAFGASPRSVQTFIKLGMVRAACEGRAYVMPEDVKAFAGEVLRHRIILKPEAAYVDGGVTTDAVVQVILKYTNIVNDPDAYKRP